MSMKKILIFIFLFLPFSSNADIYKWVIIQSSQTQDNQVILNMFPNSKIFQSRKECERELIETELSRNSHRKAISRNDEIFIVEYWSNGSIHTSISCEEISKIIK